METTEEEEFLTPEEQEAERIRLEEAEKEIAEYERVHGKPMSKTGQAMRRLGKIGVVYDERLFL